MLYFYCLLGAVGWSAVCDSGIYLSYSIPFRELSFRVATPFIKKILLNIINVVRITGSIRKTRLIKDRAELSKHSQTNYVVVDLLFIVVPVFAGFCFLSL